MKKMIYNELQAGEGKITIAGRSFDLDFSCKFLYDKGVDALYLEPYSTIDNTKFQYILETIKRTVPYHERRKSHIGDAYIFWNGNDLPDGVEIELKYKLN